MRNIKFEYGFESVNGIVKKVYHLSEIPNIAQKCDVWSVLPIAYVRQFTGLKDSKRTKEFPEGQEVYEKDTVEDDHKCRYLVVWSDIDCCYYFELLGIDSIDEGELFDVNEIGGYKIIGNEHQTPELLKTD